MLNQTANQNYTHDSLEELKSSIAAILPTPLLTPAPIQGTNIQNTQKRVICIRFYINSQEEAKLNDICQGINRSRFIRAKLFGNAVPRPRRPLPQINRDVYIQISCVSSNINQIAKAINTAAKQSHALPLGDKCLLALQEINENLTQITKMLYGFSEQGEQNGEQGKQRD